jgi:hypothetical protein
MNRALARFNASPPLPPQHAGAPLRCGKTVLMRVPGSFFDVKVELRGIDDDLALVHFRGTGQDRDRPT